MRGWLLDTNVVSALAPGRPERSESVESWLEARGDALYLSVVSIVELSAGIGKLGRSGAQAKADLLRGWLAAILEHYAERVLPVDVTIASRAGDLTALARAQGAYPGFADTVLAATAHTQGLVLLTRNAKHFGILGVRHLDPFQELPGE